MRARGSISSARIRVRGLLQLLAGLCGVAAALVAQRFLLQLLVANPANAVASAIRAFSRPLLFPWSRLWPPVELPALAVEPAAVAALASYLFLGLLLGFLNQILTRREANAVPNGGKAV